MKYESFILRWLFGLIALLFSLFLSSPLFAGETSEMDVKAAYLFNFAKFVDWPERAFTLKTSPIVIGILGDDSLSESLKGLELKKIKGRSLALIHMRNKEQIKACHMIYIGDSERKDLQDILYKLSGKSCLTVSSISDFALKGGMIGFVRKGNNIRFEANLDVMRQVELTVSSRLLNLAQIVKN